MLKKENEVRVINRYEKLIQHKKSSSELSTNYIIKYFRNKEFKKNGADEQLCKIKKYEFLKLNKMMKLKTYFGYYFIIIMLFIANNDFQMCRRQRYSLIINLQITKCYKLKLNRVSIGENKLMKIFEIRTWVR